MRAICSSAYAPEIIEGWLQSRTVEGYLAPIERGQLSVAVADGVIIGFGEAIPGRIVALYVDPDHTGLRVGSLLMQHLLAIACRPPAEKVMLESTLNAQSFYERFGFREVGRNAVCRNVIAVPIVEMERACA